VKDKNVNSPESQYTDIASKGGLARSKPDYSDADLENVPAGAIQMGLGCGNPSALAELREGQTVLDLGSGAGLDAFVAAGKVGPTGKVIGVDVTPAMVAKANQFAKEGGFKNVEFVVGQIEKLPVPDASVDCVISNCVINHSPDKVAVFWEAFRVLKPGGLLLVSDLVVQGEMPDPTSTGVEVWKDWLAVACGKDEYLAAARLVGFGVSVVSESVYTGPAMTEALAGKIVGLGLRMRKLK